MQHIDPAELLVQQRDGHDRPHDADQGDVKDRPRPDELVDFRQPRPAALGVEVIVIGDQPRRAADFFHDVVAGVDA